MLTTSWQNILRLTISIVLLFHIFHFSSITISDVSSNGRLNHDTSLPLSNSEFSAATVHAEIDEIPSDIELPNPHKEKDVEEQQALTSQPIRRTFDIIVNLYKEDIGVLAKTLNEIRSLQVLQGYSMVRTFVYVKDEEADLSTICTVLQTEKVFSIPNRGREAGSYLTHIISNWNDLANHNLFMQAELHHPESAVGKLVDYLRPNTGVLNIGYHEVCTCEDCKDPWNSIRRFSRIQELYSMVNREICPTQVALSYLGQIVVSRTRLRYLPRSLYVYLQDILESDLDHPIHSDPHEAGFQDTPSNPYFGHTLERSYGLLWDCHSPDLVKSCGVGFGALDRRRQPEDLDDKCQCLDPDVYGVD